MKGGIVMGNNMRYIYILDSESGKASEDVKFKLRYSQNLAKKGPGTGKNKESKTQITGFQELRKGHRYQREYNTGRV